MLTSTMKMVSTGLCKVVLLVSFIMLAARGQCMAQNNANYTFSTPVKIILAHEKAWLMHGFNGDECDNFLFNDMNLVENKLENRKYLKLSPVKKEDAGTYKCFTSAGVLHTIELNVIKKFETSSSRKYVLVNPSICNESHENVTFTCDAEYHGPSDLKLNWMRWTR
ncbi:hypothetical protein HELRODRAFT_177396 [Helobdella robusta]|uniref:Ig-like domain-containing protein n=1 Tax=Helobdella robusta TaxID=6412 RepID=T1FBM3_HELRO|nr:hypothetical protein HELRODRAFT_177396 [Helobdella robusta]ESN98153.1 hypothetical protein HELRODRAFT_177396 [Helobdella robusta]